MESLEEPERLLCPITRQVFRDPVFVPESGNTYERSALIRFWATCPAPRDPLTNVCLKSKNVFTNWSKRREVQSFLDENAGLIPAGWKERKVPPASDESRDKKLWKYKTIYAHALTGILSAALGIYILKGKRNPNSEIAQFYNERNLRLLEKIPPAGSLLKVVEALDDKNNIKLLRILIPTKNMDAEVATGMIFPLVWLTFIAVWTRGAYRAGIGFAALFSLPFWSTGLWLLKSVLAPVIQETEVVLSPTAFSIAYDMFKIGWLNINYRWLVKGKSTDITGCSVETLSYLNGQPIKHVVLRAGVNSYAFGHALKYVEKEHIVMEILEYLRQNV
eukprot:CAMPEP_0204866780 /NCGR_PEP_ID=MMETSP1348-20121228/19085_1 /ASSEMBLY_ACC=CAM_ASM_000700 /TAXON_ID=215587 /ORGANISM="Aplanochytrium stocchinoi, Strain GSBS06" /LENGTH=332 /DNA_ID=CAMNT_0052018833 /DNA_START=13 /DNA_END=1008 /DNA_ORIENTATION=-